MPMASAVAIVPIATVDPWDGVATVIVLAVVISSAREVLPENVRGALVSLDFHSAA